MTEAAPVVVDLAGGRAAVDAALATLTDELLPRDTSEPAWAAARYALQGPGKRLRGILVAAAYRACGGTGDVTPLAAAVEIVHCYSLVHDDLPCMDDDDVRRGRPTAHRVYGPDAAVVGGAILVPVAIRAVALGAARLGLTPATTARVVREICRAAGARGMIAGQWRDLCAEDNPALALAELEALHAAKTGALIAAAARLGGLAAGATDPVLRALGTYGADLGLAFQIVDDVLDVTATTADLGKTAGRDLVLGKSTYPARLGVTGAMDRAHALVHDACSALDHAELLTPELRHIADLVITRTH